MQNSAIYYIVSVSVTLVTVTPFMFLVRLIL